MDWLDTLHQIRTFGLEYVFKRYPGLYDGQVVDVRDPEKRGRVRCFVPAIGAREPSREWFRPMLPMAGKGRGAFFPPSVGDTVSVCFENGDPSRPRAYLGGWYGAVDGASEVPGELGYDTASPPAPRRSGLVTRMGHALIFNDTPNEETVTLRWRQSAEGDAARTNLSATASRSGGKTSTLVFDARGGITIQTSADGLLKLEGNGDITVSDGRGNRILLRDGALTVEGDRITLKADAVSIDADRVSVGSNATLRAVLFEPLLQWLNTHVHPTGTGPSGPAVAPCTDAIGSSTVTIKG